MKQPEVDRLLDKHGIHPIHDPMGECCHHSDDADLTEEDVEVGEVAWYLGKLFSEEEFANPQWMQQVMTSQIVWQKVARALRIHGLRIIDNPLRRSFNSHMSSAHKPDSSATSGEAKP